MCPVFGRPLFDQSTARPLEKMGFVSTLHHFWPHHKLLLRVVKGKKHVRSKKAAYRTMQECEENHRDRLCSRGASKSIPSVPLLDEQILTLEGRRALRLNRYTGRAVKNSPLL